uniref:HAT C-terminal dimerisation domain-containing protein n=1 Tax=Astyanax mexicanus TaxID=7994 RepID=A0A3B1JVS3_ASTMX
MPRLTLSHSSKLLMNCSPVLFCLALFARSCRDDLFLCEVCLSHFSVSHGGEYDVKRHRQCETHKKRVAQKEVSQSMHTFLLKPKQDSNVDKVTAAELTSVYHTVKHSLSYRSEDCGNKLTSAIFPDSEIAKKMSCGRTKAASLVTDVLAPASVESCDKKAHTPFFSVASDASNHGTTKLFPLSLRYWTPKLESKILDFYEDSHESAATIHCQITSKLEENGLQLDMISAYTADNASVNYGKNNSVFQKLKADNSGIIKANCVAHIVHNCAKHAGDMLNVDIDSVVNKIFSHFSVSAQRTEELKEVFAFVEEDYHVVRRHVPTRWLSLWPAVQRLHDSWAAIKSYFLSLGENQWATLELQAYLAFLNNILKIFHDVVLLLEGQDGTVCELYDIMLTLKTKLQQRQIDCFFGMETSAILQQFPDQKAATIKHDFSNFYKTALNYLEKWYDFTDNNYQKNVRCLALKSSFTFSQLSDAVEVLQIGSKLDMDELYEEYCVTLPRQQEIVERKAPVVEKWALLLKSTKTPNLTAVASFLFSIPITNASVERVFSLVTAAWTDQRNRCSVELIKSEIQVKTNFEYSCKEFYSFALKQKALLEAARSSKKYKAKRNI